ncbi:zinc finger protein 846 isoform X2 [Malaya genurostris]|nr:zinc finger protein 846 isoform X2 [Malaya genurostris]
MDSPALETQEESTSEKKNTKELQQLRFYIENYERLCRLCLTNDRLVNLYSIVQGRNVIYVRNFVKQALRLLDQTIDKKDRLPNFICEKCERNLNIIFNFKKKCDESRRILEKVRDKTISLEDLMKSDVCPTVKEFECSRARIKANTTKSKCEEILKNLPQDIHIGKRREPVKKQIIACSVGAELVSTVMKLEPDDIKREVASLGLIFPETDLNLDLNDFTNLVDEGPSRLAQDESESSDEEFDADPDSDSEWKPEESNQTNFIPSDVKEHENRGNNPNKRERKVREVAVTKTGRLSKKLPKEKTICQVCGALVNNIKCHMITHEDIRPHQCEQCPKSFTSRNKLQSHINSVHLKKRDFKCEVCGKAFLEKNNLKGHQRIHNGDRKYKCDLCPKTFLFAGTLRCHKLTHTQDKKHECQVCGKLFLMRTTLNKHLYVHSNERPHKCDLCEKTFRTSTHKIIHMRTHTGEKPLQCRICGIGFAHHKARSVHMKTKHAKELVAMDMLDERGHLKF